MDRCHGNSEHGKASSSSRSASSSRSVSLVCNKPQRPLEVLFCTLGSLVTAAYSTIRGQGLSRSPSETYHQRSALISQSPRGVLSYDGVSVPPFPPLPTARPLSSSRSRRNSASDPTGSLITPEECLQQALHTDPMLARRSLQTMESSALQRELSGSHP